MTDHPTVSILGPAAVKAGREALEDEALTRLGRDLGTVHVEAITEAVIRAALAAVLPSGEVACTESQECDPDSPEEYRLCDAHEAAQSHARGVHRWCDVDCREAMGTVELTNFVVAKGYPGTAGALRELLHRAAEDAVAALAGREVPPPVLLVGDEDPGTMRVETDRYAVSPVPYGHRDYRNLLIYVVRHENGWGITDGAGWLANRRGSWTLNSDDAQIFTGAPEAKRVAVAIAEGIRLRAVSILEAKRRREA